MNKEAIRHQLNTLIGEDLVWIDVPMKEEISFRVGGAADFLAMPEGSEALADLLKFCTEKEIPYFVMGNGSNLLVKDGGYRGIIIKTRNMDQIEVAGTQIIVGAGALLRKAADTAWQHGLSGLEFASGIPGTVGGAVVMNAGAYGGEMKQIVSAVEAVNSKGRLRHFSAEDCDFAYRHSLFLHSDWVITKVFLNLRQGDPNKIHDKMLDLNARRREKQPLEYPSAGSTFKRPAGYFAGKLIQDAGFRGFSVGGAQLSEKHCGFVINRDHATAADILQLIAEIQRGVQEKFGVDLEPEVIVMGEEA